MEYIKDVKIVLTEDEINYVAGFDFDEDSDIWLAENKVEMEYDTLWARDHKGNPEHGTIYGYVVISHDSKLWKCTYAYNNMAGFSSGEVDNVFTFNPTKPKSKRVVEYT